MGNKEGNGFRSLSTFSFYHGKGKAKHVLLPNCFEIEFGVRVRSAKKSERERKNECGVRVRSAKTKKRKSGERNASMKPTHMNELLSCHLKIFFVQTLCYPLFRSPAPRSHFRTTHSNSALVFALIWQLLKSFSIHLSYLYKAMMLLWILLAYLLYRFIFYFLIPIIRVSSQMRSQVRNFRENMDQAQSESSTYTQGNTESQPKKPTEKTGEYIDFEEVKE
jgi:hypothetical protein